jgi:energy-coupling factor transport system permease protein
MSRAADAANVVLSFGYRDRGGPLQLARATTAIGWCAAIGLAIALNMNPLVLGLLLLCVMVAAWRCRVLAEVGIALAISLPLTIAIALINPIASGQGTTVLLAGIDLPLIGTFDITREALAYGVILGLRSATIFALCALWVCCVSPDQLLRVLRRYSVRSAIAASLSVRFVPTLARDGANLALARACRPGEPPGTATVVRAAFARSLERAGDSALALETRGFELARPLKIAPPPRNRVDLLLIVSAALVALLTVGGKSAGLAAITAYPTTAIAAAPRDLAFALLIALACLLPVLAPRREAQ